jgi:hypothetical protein
MIGLSSQQVECVGQQVQHGAQGGGGTCRAAGKVQDERAVAVLRVDAADAAAERGEGRVAQAVLADDFRNAGDEAVADGEGGIGGDIAIAEAGAARGDDQTGAGCGVAERLDEAGEVVGDDLDIEDARTGLGENGCCGRSGEIDLVAGGAAVAGGDHDGGAAGKRAGGIVVQVHAVQNRCTERRRAGTIGEGR